MIISEVSGELVNNRKGHLMKKKKKKGNKQSQAALWWSFRGKGELTDHNTTTHILQQPPGLQHKKYRVQDTAHTTKPSYKKSSAGYIWAALSRGLYLYNFFSGIFLLICPYSWIFSCY